MDIFTQSHRLLLEAVPSLKIAGVAQLYAAHLSNQLSFATMNTDPVQPEITYGKPANLQLVPPKALPKRRFHTLEGRAATIHALLHIEFNAINLALDAIYRFRGMPMHYYRDWLKVAREEAYHFNLLAQYLAQLGYQYGDFSAHQSLWEMAEKTGYDVLVRMALVPRLLEARGLDVAPELGKRLWQAKDKTAAEIVSIIYHDEIGHVKVGNYWYHTLCEERQLDPLETFVTLLKKHAPDHLRGPLAISARRQAGFTESELSLFNKLITSLAL